MAVAHPPISTTFTSIGEGFKKKGGGGCGTVREEAQAKLGGRDSVQTDGLLVCV